MKKGIQNIAVTLWHNDGAESSSFSVLPVIARACELVYGEPEGTALFECIGIAEKDFCCLDIPNIFNGKIFNYGHNPSKYMLYCDSAVGSMIMLNRKKNIL